MTAVISRILLRYLAAFLATAGYLAPDIAEQFGTDPDLIMALGAAIALGTEAVYTLAKRWGWST